MNNNEYDFCSMGFRDAKMSMENCYNRAIQIEKQYGVNARMEYEVGIAMTIPQYDRFKSAKDLIAKINSKESKNLDGDDDHRNTLEGRRNL